MLSYDFTEAWPAKPDKAGFGWPFSFFLMEAQDKEQALRYNRTLHTIHTYIREHLNEEITLTVLAEQVYLNPVYLSHIYKQLTGQKLGTYITSQRI